MILSEEQFIAYYLLNNRFPNGAYNNPQKTLNQAQLRSKYKKYQTSMERALDRREQGLERKLEAKPKSKSEYVKKVDLAMKKAHELDPRGEVWRQNLSEEEIEIVSRAIALNPIYGVLEGAHLVGRGRSKGMASVVKNILILPKFVHLNIDLYKNPFSEKHEQITEEQRNQIWVRLVGEERWDYLQEELRKSLGGFEDDL